MAETQGQDVVATMTEEQLIAYKQELVEELHDLEFSQFLHATDYKASRIKTIKRRLGLRLDNGE